MYVVDYSQPLSFQTLPLPILSSCCGTPMKLTLNFIIQSSVFLNLLWFLSLSPCAAYWLTFYTQSSWWSILSSIVSNCLLLLHSFSFLKILFGSFKIVPGHFWKSLLIVHFFFFFLIFIYLFIYLFMAVLGLCLCARAFSSCGKRGPLFIAVRGPLTIAASLVAEHRLQTRRLSNCGSRA